VRFFSAARPPPPPSENEERSCYRYKLVLGCLILIRQVIKGHSSGSGGGGGGGGGGKHDALAPPPCRPHTQTHTHTHISSSENQSHLGLSPVTCPYSIPQHTWSLEHTAGQLIVHGPISDLTPVTECDPSHCERHSLI